MLLSIGMIVKNESEYLERCLEGLKPILDAVPSELIIVDTGSTDDTIEIAKRYTDKILETEWTGDFSAARNKNLFASKGKWYMPIDADEIFIDSSGVIEFFTSNQHKRFNTASFPMKHVKDKEGKTGGSNITIRLFKKFKGMKWSDAVHENIPIHPPTKALHAVIHHFGYFFDGPDGEQKLKAKHQRNIVPLLEIYESENPKTPRTIVHLIREYAATGDLAKRRELLDIGLKLVPKETNENKGNFHFFKHNLFHYYLTNKDYEILIKEVEEYFDSIEKPQTISPDIRSWQALAYAYLKNYEKAAWTFIEAIKLFEQRIEGTLATEAEFHVTIGDATPEVKESFATNAVSNFIADGDFDNAEKYQNLYLPDRDLSLYNRFVANCLKEEDFEKLTKAYAHIREKHEVGTTAYYMNLSIIESYLKTYEQKLGFAEALLEKFEPDTDYIRLNNLRNLYYKEQDLTEELEYFEYKDVSVIYGDLAFFAMAKNKDITPYIQNAKITDTIIFIRSMVRNENFEEIFSNYLKAHDLKSESIKTSRILAEVTVHFMLTTKDEESKLNFFETFIIVNKNYLSSIYKDHIFTDENINDLSERDMFTYWASKAYHFKDNNDRGRFVSYMGKALNVMPAMKNAINAVIRQVQEEMEEEELAREKIQIEINRENEALQRHIFTLKSAIVALIDTDPVKAMELLEGYEQINPADADIPEMREQLEIG